MSSNMISGPSVAGNWLITNPSENDVLFGRGASMFHWPGNLKFRELVSERSEEYVTTSCRARKHNIAREIIGRVRSEMNGRFLIKASATGDDRMTSDGNPGPWVVAAESLVTDKVKQAIREKSYQGKKVVRKEVQSSPRTAQSLKKSHMIKKNPPRILSNDAKPASKTTEKKQSRKLTPCDVDIEEGSASSRRHPEEAHQEAPNHAPPADTTSHRTKTKPNRSLGYDVGDQDVKRQRMMPFGTGRDRQLQSLLDRSEASRQHRTTNRLQNPFDAVNADLGRATAVSGLIRRREEETLRRLAGRSLDADRGSVHQDERSLPFSIGRDDSLSGLSRHDTPADILRRHQILEGYEAHPTLQDPYRSTINDPHVTYTEIARLASGSNPQSTGIYQQLNFERNSESMQAYRPSANLDAQMNGLHPSREVANNDSIGHSLLSGSLASLPLSQRLTAPADQGGLPAAANSREGLLEMLLQQRRLNERLLELRRQKER